MLKKWTRFVLTIPFIYFVITEKASHGNYLSNNLTQTGIDVSDNYLSLDNFLELQQDSTTDETETTIEQTSSTVTESDPSTSNTTADTTTNDATTEEPTTENTTTEEPTTENTTTTEEPTTEPTTNNTTPTSTVTPTTIEQTSSTVTESDPSTSNTTADTTTDTTLNTTAETTTDDATTITTTNNTTPTSTVTPTTTITTTPTTIPPPITANPTPPGCLRCTATDSKGHQWSVCAGTVGRQNCSETVTNSTGQITWKCSPNGQFETDGPNYEGCKSDWLIDFVEESGKIKDTNSTVEYFEKLKKQISPSQNVSSNYFGHEIGTFNEILVNLTKAAINFDDDLPFENVATSAMAVAERLITTQEPWHHLNSNENRSQLATNLFQTIEDTSFLLTSKTQINVSRLYEKHLISDNQFMVTSLAFLKSFSGVDDIRYPRIETQGSVLILPAGWTKVVKNEKIECVGMFMDPYYASLIMPGQFRRLGLESDEERKKILNGQILTFTIASGITTATLRLLGNGTIRADKNFQFQGRGVQIIFQHVLETWGDEAYDMPRKLRSGEMPKAARGTAKCVFWDKQILQWSQKGCKLVSSTKSETICECNHLTSFAILMDVHNYVGKNLGLEVLTIFLSIISITCLLFTILIILMIKMAKTKRTVITLHLAICLVVGQFLVLLVLDKDYLNLSHGMCIASGIATHYIFLAAFGWMAFQGVHLYSMAINVFSNAKIPFFVFPLLSYGVPLVIVAITCMSGYLSGNEPYGGELVCWLNGHYIWAFMGPVLIIVLINAVILCLSLWKSYRIRNRSPGVSSASFAETRRRVSAFRRWVRGSLALTILLGLTWLSGFLMLVPEIPGIVAAYFFTILNASQGIWIFLFDLFFDVKVRQGVHRQYGRHLPSRLNTWLKTTSTPLSAATSSTSGNETSNIQNNKGSISSAPPSNMDNSLPPVPPPRLKRMQKAAAQALPSLSATLSAPITRQGYGVVGDATTEAKPYIFDGPTDDVSRA